MNAQALQHTPGDKHGVETLGETWSAWSDGLSVSVAPLRKTDIIGYEDTGEGKWLGKLICDHRVVVLIQGYRNRYKYLQELTEQGGSCFTIDKIKPLFFILHPPLRQPNQPCFFELDII